MDTLLQDITDDIYYRLHSDAELSDVMILKRDEHNLTDRINAALTGRIKRSGSTKKGAAITIAATDITGTTATATPTPGMEVQVTIECAEDVLVNAGSNGTGITAQAQVARVIALLHGLQLPGRTTAFTSPQTAPTARQLNLPTGQRGWEVIHRAQAWFNHSPIVDPVTIDDTASQITLTTTTSGATIYYTTDGSYPTSTNDNATTYSTPFATPASDTEIRAAAEKTAYDPTRIITRYQVP